MNNKIAWPNFASYSHSLKLLFLGCFRCVSSRILRRHDGVNVEFNCTFCYCRIGQNAIWWPRFRMEYKSSLNDFIWKRSLITSSVSWGKGSTPFSHSNAEARSWWTKKQSMYEHVLPNLALVLLFVFTEVECGKGPTTLSFITYDSLQCQLMNFYICTEFFETKLSKNCKHWTFRI